ncbi:XdhC/CoxI family protein [Acidobacteria bacterium AH-259-D05]|nr:XdhC/CoxI family protein [Acidobacteria bacterium AH-259-D05]
MSDLFKELAQSLRNQQLVALSTVIMGPGIGSKLLIWPDGRSSGNMDSADLEREVRQCAETLLKEQKSKRVQFHLKEEAIEVFIEVFPPSPKLIIVGAVHVAIHLITFAQELGFRTVVVDPRSAFATPERFSHADELIVEWPQEALSPSDFNEGTYLVVLSHDEKLDNPALKLALESPCRYIGALGSRKTHAKRAASLKEMGITDQQMSQIYAPIGLNLGGRRPEEIAIAILAQIVAVRNGADL